MGFMGQDCNEFSQHDFCSAFLVLSDIAGIYGAVCCIFRQILPVVAFVFAAEGAGVSYYYGGFFALMGGPYYRTGSLFLEVVFVLGGFFLQL